jgi:hypothetical protein
MPPPTTSTSHDGGGAAGKSGEEGDKKVFTADGVRRVEHAPGPVSLSFHHHFVRLMFVLDRNKPQLQFV